MSCGWPHTMHPYASLPRADTGAGRHGCGSTSTDALRRRRAPWLTTSVRRWWMSTSALMRWKHHSCGFRRRERPFFCCREEKTPLFCFFFICAVVAGTAPDHCPVGTPKDYTVRLRGWRRGGVWNV